MKNVSGSKKGRPGAVRSGRKGNKQVGSGGQGAQEQEDDCRDDHADNRDRGVLTAQVGRGAFLDGRGDLHHARVAGRRAKHLLAGKDAIEQRDDAAHDGGREQRDPEHDGDGDADDERDDQPRPAAGRPTAPEAGFELRQHAVSLTTTTGSARALPSSHGGPVRTTVSAPSVKE